MSEEELRALHDGRWPWCRSGSWRHEHSERLNDGPRVNGYPAGPMWQLRDRWVPDAVQDPT